MNCMRCVQDGREVPFNPFLRFWVCTKSVAKWLDAQCKMMLKVIPTTQGDIRKVVAHADATAFSFLQARVVFLTMAVSGVRSPVLQAMKLKDVCLIKEPCSYRGVRMEPVRTARGLGTGWPTGVRGNVVPEAPDGRCKAVPSAA
jgi:hypothetical protein